MSNKIKAQDLRIGNILSFHSKNEKVIELSEDWIMLSISNKVPLTAIGLSAIPLTEEIMVKCCTSRELFHDGVVIYHMGLFKGFSQNGRVWVSTGLGPFANNLGHIKHLHQLQNLIFAIEGRELEIKL